ncbi:MAG: DUF1592 domain-containing protein [Polyangia bacterium]
MKSPPNLEPSKRSRARPPRRRAATTRVGLAAIATLAMTSTASTIFMVGCTATVADSPGGSTGTGSTRGSGSAGAGGNRTTGGENGGGAGGASSGAGDIVLPATPPAAALLPTSRLVRLSHLQWSNTVKDLLKVTDIAAIESSVTGDAVVGLDNDADSLFVDETFRSDMATAAVKLADKVGDDATALARLVPSDAPTDLAGKARSFISALGQRAYRRPLTDVEVAQATTLFNKSSTLYPGVDTFVGGAKLVIQFFLQSPHFLYRTELSTVATNGKVPLGAYELATKLSYALTNSMPDDELFRAAGAGQLTTPTNLANQAMRLVSSERGALGRDHLHFQMLRLGAYDGINRDKTVFPDFTANTPSAMRQEVLAFTRWIFNQNYGVKEIYTAPVGFVNSTLAPIYQLTGTFTDQLTKVDLDPGQRSGLLTQAGFLAEYALGNDPDSIHRGVFVNQRILCVTLPPPSPDAKPLGALEPNMTNRERVEKTTGSGTCGEGCHSTWINTAGFAFEAFDAIGKYRTMDRGKPVNTADTYPFNPEGPKSYSNAVEFSRLIARSTQAHSCYTRNWLSYINGRPVATEELPLVDYWALASRAGKLSMKDMILAMVTNEAFVNRLP